MAFKLFFSFSLFTKKNSLPSVIRGGEIFSLLKRKTKKNKKKCLPNHFDFLSKEKMD